MIPLIKIRATYLKRIIIKVLIFYCSIPIITFFGLIIYYTSSSHEKIEMNPKQTFNYSYGQEGPQYYFSKDKNFSVLYKYFANTSLVVNNEQIGKKLVDFIKDNVDIVLKLYDDEDKLDNYAQSIIVLKYDEEKDSYKFTLKEKEIREEYTRNISYPLEPQDLSTIQASDVFKYEIESDYFGTYSNIDSMNKIFLDYQALFAKFLIEKIKGKDIKRNINFTLGFNSFPESVKNHIRYDYFEVTLCYLIGFPFTFIFIYFSMQMLDEKESKLEKLLERQGINFLKYFFTWFINFIIVSLLSIAATIFGGIAILDSFLGLYILVVFLFILSLFFLMFLIFTVSKNKKTGLILVNLIGIGSFIVGLVLSQSSLSKVVQIILNVFFPVVNIFFSFKLITKLQFLGKYSFDYTLLNYNGINFIENVIMFASQIIFYFFIILFVKSYQNSGLSFIDCIKSKFKKVSRIMYALIDEKKELEQNINHEELSEKNKALKNQNIFLNIKNVTKKYEDLIAVNNFNGELFKNEIFCLLGHNGAGKTTLVKMISGAEDPDSGDIF